MRGRETRLRGTTRIELVTILAMASLLLGFTIPTLSAARMQGQSSLCQSRLRTWGRFWHLHVDEHDGKFATGVKTGSARSVWFEELYPYWAEKPEIRLCPTAPKRFIFNSKGHAHAWGNQQHSYIHSNSIQRHRNAPTDSSYGFNLWLYSIPKTHSNIQGRPAQLHMRRAEVKDTVQVPLFLDSMWRGGGPWYGDLSGQTSNPSFKGIRPPDHNGQWIRYDYAMMHFAMHRHATSVNAVFMDESVRHLNARNLWNLKWHRNYDVSRGFTGEWPAWMIAQEGESPASGL